MHFAQEHKTAVIYFTLSPGAQVEKKVFSLGASRHVNTSIASVLYDHTYLQIKESGLPYFLFDETSQQGETFGERITLAFDTIFKQGFENVIIVGSDTPNLKSGHLRQASKLLSCTETGVVLGPADDGGTWLMGFQKDSMNLDTFSSLPWNTSRLFSSLLEEYQQSQHIAVLEQYADVDQAVDLQLFLKSPADEKSIIKLKLTIAQLLMCYTTYEAPRSDSFISSLHSYSFLLRGPPLRSDSIRFTN